MISSTLRICMLIAIAVYFVLLVMLLKKKSLSLKYTILWLFAGLLMLVLAIWPGILGWLAGVVGIELPVNALFAIMFFCVIIILVSMTSIVSKLNRNVTELVQQQAILEKRVRELEDSKNV